MIGGEFGSGSIGSMQSPLSQSPNTSYSPSKYITTVDVYDLAESINRDFEELAEKHGKGPIEGIVKKVVCALETLEALAKNNDKENVEMADLQRSVERLQREKTQRTRDKDNLEKDVIDMEENYKREIDELTRMIKSLQSENKEMKSHLSSIASPSKQKDALDPSEGVVSIREEEFEMLMELRQASHKQKEQIKELQRDVESYCCEVENLQNSIERLIRQNKELLRKNTSLQKQGRMLIHERAELLRRLQEMEEANFELRRALKYTSRELETQKELERGGEDSPRFTLNELREVLHEKSVLKARVIELEEQLDAYRCSSSTSQLAADEPAKDELLVLPNLSAMWCFSKEERHVEVDESSRRAIDDGCSPTTSAAAKDSDCEAEAPDQSSEECVVYGPINKEPEEKLHPWKYQRKSSGVRRFFRFFKESLTPSGVPSSPRRSSLQQQTRQTSRVDAQLEPL